MISMTKLEGIIARLEALQNDSPRATQEELDAMRAAKSRLLGILR